MERGVRFFDTLWMFYRVELKDDINISGRCLNAAGLGSQFMKISNARYLLLVVAIAASAMPAWAVPAPAPPIDEWIAQLGDSDAGKRDKARRILQGLGEPVLAKVRQAAKEHPDPAVRKLAEEVAACIDRGEILSISTGNTSYWLNRVAFTPDDQPYWLPEAP